MARSTATIPVTILVKVWPDNEPTEIVTGVLQLNHIPTNEDGFVNVEATDFPKQLGHILIEAGRQMVEQHEADQEATNG